MNTILGLNQKPEDFTFLQVALRAIIVFVLALIMVRFGDKRFLSKKTAFDAILGFILASMLARAVNGSSSFWPTLAGGFVLVLLHRLLAFLSRRSHWVGNLIKGTSDPVIHNGRVIESALRHNDLSREDLLEDLRLNGRVGETADVKDAFVERNGEVSVVPKKS